MTADKGYVVERADATGYEPFIHQGVNVGEMRALTVEGSSGGALDAGLWRSEPATHDYFFADDETFLVLEGSATIELPDTGETIEVTAGDMAYFVSGTRSVWTITQRFKKFVVVPT
jgi:uncharacterized cupin superfamily protein